MPVTTHTKLAGAAGAEGPDSAGPAVARAVAALDGAAPGLVLAFPDGKQDPVRAAAAAEEAAAGAPVCGLTSGGEAIAGGTIVNGSSAIAFEESVQVGIGVATGLGADPAGAGRHATASALAALDPASGHPVLLLFFDTTASDQSKVIDGAYAVAGGRIPLAGGASGGQSPSQLALGVAHTDAVVAVALVSPRPVGVGIGHGCSPRSVPAIVTRAEGQLVKQLDGRPAVEVYLERLGTTAAEVGDFHAFAVEHPLAQPELSGDVRLRHIRGCDEEGALICATHIPANAAVQFTEQTAPAIVRSAWDAVEAALAPLGGKPARAALAFDCGGRRSALGTALGEEADAIARSFGTEPPPIAGLFTHGEVGRVRGAKGDRNHALVVVAFA